MAGKPFNPFEDEDELEFVPGGGGAASQPTEEATRIKAKPVAPLKLTFEELNDPGADTRGASEIGADNLGADEFLTGIKRKDFDSAVDRARVSQGSPALVAVQGSRVGREVKTPLYLLALGIVLFIASLVGGVFWYKGYQERAEAERFRAVNAAAHSKPAK